MFDYILGAQLPSVLTELDCFLFQYVKLASDIYTRVPWRLTSVESKNAKFIAIFQKLSGTTMLKWNESKFEWYFFSKYDFLPITLQEYPFWHFEFLSTMYHYNSQKKVNFIFPHFLISYVILFHEDRKFHHVLRLDLGSDFMPNSFVLPLLGYLNYDKQ